MRPASRSILALAFLLGVSACAQQSGLHDVRDPSAGPEEFSVLPTKPLETPTDLATLPVPTPGAVSRADVNPQADVIAALGGNPARLAETAIPQSDAALVANVSRYGVPADVRATAAQEDEAFRNRFGRFTGLRLFKVDSYQQVYQSQRLDPNSALTTYRRAGVPTPTAPPN